MGRGRPQIIEIDPRFAARVAEERRQRIAAEERPISEVLVDEWFPEEAAFFDDGAQLTAALCGRRAGKTRGVVRDHLRDLLEVPGYRGLYLNSTRGEAERIAWIGNRADGFKPLIESLKLPLVLDNSDLTVHNPATDGWMYLRGADDEAELRKALGGAYHKVTWDEWQKIPPKLAPSIREVFFPALLDFGGKFRGTGTPSRQMSGIAWDVTRPEKDKRTPGWSVHEWNLLANPYWGNAKRIAGAWFVVWGARDEIVSGPHEPGELAAAVAGARWAKGILALQALYGGADVAPIDSPIMQREGFGRWVREDAAYVYHVHKVAAERLLYAPHRVRADGFVDVARALEDLPWPWQDGQFALGADLGYYPDPFAFVLWGWHREDPRLYEVCSWRKTHLKSDAQVAALRAVREIVAIGAIDADAGGGGKPVVTGWSDEWVERYGLPIAEAQKAHKSTAIEVMNNDIVSGNVALRDGGPLYEEMSLLQWSSIVSATGRQIEDPTIANDCCDAGLYSHRRTYAHRYRAPVEVPKFGTPERAARDESELEEELMEEMTYGTSFRKTRR